MEEVPIEKLPRMVCGEPRAKMRQAHSALLPPRAGNSERLSKILLLEISLSHVTCDKS